MAARSTRRWRRRWPGSPSATARWCACWSAPCCAATARCARWSAPSSPARPRAGRGSTRRCCSARRRSCSSTCRTTRRSICRCGSRQADHAARHYAGLVNAVLRKVAAEGPRRAGRARRPRPRHAGLADGALARRLWRRGRRRHRRGPPPEAALDLTVKADAAAWAERLGGRRAADRLGAASSPRAPVPQLEGFAEGAWWVQDAAAALPARLLGDVRGLRIADLCAAPGGKTLQLAAAGASVTAVDRAEAGSTGCARTSNAPASTAEIVCADVLSLRRRAVRRRAARCAVLGHRHHPPPPRRRLDQGGRRTSRRWPSCRRRCSTGRRRWSSPAGGSSTAPARWSRRRGRAQIEALLARRPDVTRLPIERGRDRRRAGLDHRGGRAAHPALPPAGSPTRDWPASTASSPPGWSSAEQSSSGPDRRSPARRPAAPLLW